ncbi:MAG: RDD family protein [Pyrinomonadaceae bacterium]
MMNDTVREELRTKISIGTASRIESKPVQMSGRGIMTSRPAMIAPQLVKRQETADLVASKTSPTLIGFQNKNAALPDWRIQLQNAVQQRKGGREDAVLSSSANNGTQFAANGGAPLKVEIVQRVEAEPIPEIADRRVANAMRRIAESSETFLESEVPPKKSIAPKPIAMRPFGVVSPNGNASTATPPVRTIATQKPKLVSHSPFPVTMKRDTNRLPQIETTPGSEIKVAEPIIEKVERLESGPLPREFAEIKRIRIRAENTEIFDGEISDVETDEIEDLAPFSMRFAAGVFDLIIGAFAGMVLLSPIAFTSGDWFTTAGLLTFAGTVAIVMFLYMTVSLGFTGKTLGMRLFSLELVDAVENEYPTLYQAAVNSSIFILSLVLGGAGFLTVFFNEEKRAAHDLLSGTILVREF